MYNPEIKERFIRDITNSNEQPLRLLKFFNRTAKIEARLGKDLYEMSLEELECVANDVRGFRTSSVGQLIVLRDYLSWCAANIPGVVSLFDKIKTTNVDKMRANTVVSPRHLQVYLDALFNPESELGSDNLYRAYYWLAYSGVEEEDFLTVTVDQIDLASLTILYRGRRLPIYREAVPCIRNSVESPFFRRVNPKNGKLTNYSRVESNLLFRGGRTTPTKDSVIAAIKLARKAAITEGRTNKSLNYTGTFYSGIYYRLYEDERAGLTPNPLAIAEELVEGKEYYDNHVEALRIKRNIMADYEVWKLTF